MAFVRHPLAVLFQVVLEGLGLWKQSRVRIVNGTDACGAASPTAALLSAPNNNGKPRNPRHFDNY